MFGTDRKYLTISINDGLIKLAQSGSSGNVEKVGRCTFTATSGGEEGARALKALLATFNRKLPVICVIPASAATAKTIEVPSTDPEEIKSIINLQASRYTPYSREEVLIGYINLGLNASNNTRLLIVIVHRDVVKEKIAILDKAGLDADKIIFAPEAQARFYAKALNLKKDAPAVGVVDFSMNATSFMIIAKSALLFVRHFPIGARSFMRSAQDAAPKLEEEFKKSMEAFAQEDGNQPPSSYMVTAAREAMDPVLSSLKGPLGVSFQVNAFLNFIKATGDARKKLQTDFNDDSFLDVIAPAVTASRCEINLMPQEMLLKKTVDLQSKEVSKSGVAAVIIMVLVGLMLMIDIYFKDTYLNKNLREAYAPQMAQVKMLQQQMAKNKLVRDYIKGRMSSLDIIHELYTITPNTIYLSHITADEDGAVTIDGTADSMALVYSYVKMIDDSASFKEAQLKSASTKRDNGKDVGAFEIEFKVKEKA
ncbi:MAG: pilus assembly protein PilM [Candidatus Omnitrophica bacterium]|nr:pilus assembly protein PilM [Candidatus Omnitrophota bacterium]MDE2009324.1 pilus assembly protein PilM [Candidatus Omnitrophota bacterium]MDE2214108.1 pilus assembly protein PilM [Candidatus Omnitrophota bacterium]MDE2231145.1 pilus assembly protein PilM [Candidatus Omnitrophota bacterium]